MNEARGTNVALTLQAAVKTGFAMGPGGWGEHSFQQASVHTRDQTGGMQSLEGMHNGKEQVPFLLGAAEH